MSWWHDLLSSGSSYRFLHVLISSWRKTVNSSTILTWTAFVFPLFPGASDGKTDVFVLVYFPHFPVFSSLSSAKVTNISSFHTSSKNNTSTARQSSEWCNRAPKPEWHIMTAYVTSRQTAISLLSLSLGLVTTLDIYPSTRREFLYASPRDSFGNVFF